MPQIEIKIGGRTFEVACQEGEEQFLYTAAALLDTEASSLSTQIGRMPEARMLLMAGLMLADKTAGLEDRLAEANKRLDVLENAPAPEARTVEVAVIPTEVTETLAEIAAQAEALADEVDAAASR